ncbi:endothelin-converting enzyme homolog [Centruroides vittatus]|uniref:endothelin-converting enzyme homolog n=1 Tax=Centruroides vittatus TaxID=120091 RepID=UPI00350EC495
MSSANKSWSSFHSWAIYTQQDDSFSLPVSNILQIAATTQPHYQLQRPVTSHLTTIIQLKYANFARYGTILAHEITHSLDTKNIRTDSLGNLIINNTWSEELLMEYNKRVQCLVDQYGSYDIEGKKVDSNETKGENIADNGGLRHAYFAYKAYLKKYDNEHKDILEDFEMYTPDQMFFISYATMWCDSQTSGELKLSMNFDVHSPKKFRIIGPVSNMKEFSEAFKCGNDKPMNPVNKCILW